MKNKYLCAFLVGIVCVFWLFPKLSFATVSTESFVGDGAFGDYSATWSYDDDNFTLTVELVNTSPDSGGGFITAFAFNNPEGDDGIDITGVTLSTIGTQAANFSLIGDPEVDGTIIGSPFGEFDIGATVDGSWTGGGSTSTGIDALNPDTTETFIFTFTGTNLGSLDISDFSGEFSTIPPGNDPQYFAVRYQSFEGGGSDKVGVPEPTTMLLLGSGLVGLALYGRKRSRKERSKTS